MKPVTFNWEPVTTDSTGAPLPSGTPVTYKVWLALATGSYSTPAAETTDTSATVSPPTAGNYKSCVTAATPDGGGAQSNQVNFTSVLLLPAAPANFRLA